MATLSISKAWTEASAFLARERRLVVPVLLAFSVLPSTAQALLMPQAMDLASMMQTPLPPWATVMAYLVQIIGLIGTATIILLELGSDRPLGALIGKAARRTVVVALALLLLVAMMLPGMLVVLAPFVRGNPPQLAVPHAFFLGVTVLVSMVLLRLFLFIPSAVAEPIGPFTAIKRGWRLGRGSGFKLIGTFLLLFMVSALAVRATAFVVGSIGAMVGAGSAIGSPGDLIAVLFSSLVGAGFQGLVSAMLAALYRQAASADALKVSETSAI